MSTFVPELEPLRPPHRWLWINVSVAAVLALFSLLAGAALGPIGMLGSLALCVAVAIRMHHPRWSLVSATVGGLVLLASQTGPGVAAVVAPVIAYSMARWADPLTRRITLAVMAFASIGGPLVWSRDYGWTSGFDVGAQILGCALAVGSLYLLGRTTRTSAISRAERLSAQQERERHVMVEREQQLRMSTVHERNRIARELHDIVAHSLSVIVVQAEGGRAIAEKNPQMAAQVLTTIAETSRTSLAEMRSMVRLLRGEGEDSDDYVPAPRLEDIPELVRRTGNATLTVDGDLPQVSEAVGLAAYRVVQESLTNVLKHAGPNAHAQVSISYWPGEIQLEIRDNGRGSAAASDGQGNGVRGMRERLELHGGHLLARPQVGGGFLVRARLPYGSDTGTGPMGSAGHTVGRASPDTANGPITVGSWRPEEPARDVDTKDLR